MNRSSLPIALVAAGSLLAVPAALGAAQQSGATYAGVTSQGDSACRKKGSNDQPCDVVVKVSKKGARVSKMQIYFSAECENGLTYRGSTVFRNARIKRSAFKVAARYKETFGDGSKAKNRVKVDGRFKRGGTVSGRYSLHSSIVLASGETTTCASGPVTYEASAG